MNSRRVKLGQRSVYSGRPQFGRPARGRPRLQLGLVPRRLLWAGLGLLAVAWGMGQVFAVKTVSVAAPERAAQFETATKALVGESWRQHNLITISAANLRRDLMKTDPMIKTVEIHRRWPNGLALKITLKDPSLGWVSGNQSYLLDHDGSVIGPLPGGSSTVPLVYDGSNLPVQLGQRVTTLRFVEFTTGIAAELGRLKLSPSRYEVKDTTLDLYVTTPKYRIIFDTSRSVSEQVADLRTLQAFLAKQAKAPAEYIDLRIAGKAYYK